MQEAHLSSRMIFSQQAAAVLRHSSNSFLKRRLSQKIHDRLSKLPNETLTNCDATSLVSSLGTPLEITIGDITESDAFAKGVGFQWEKVLRRKGYVDYADVVLKLVEGGRFLEGPSDSNATGQTEKEVTIGDNINDKSATKNFATIDAALKSVHRYKPDCDGSGNPSQQLHTLSDLPIDGVSSVRKAIHQIDQIMEGIGSETLKATYGYDWGAINEAVRRNEKRLHSFKSNNDRDDNEYEIVPKTTAALDESSNKDQTEAMSNDFIIESNVHTARLLKRKRRKEEKLEPKDDSSSIEVLIGRPPSAVGEGLWSWQDVVDEIPASERKKLIRNYTNPPFSSYDDGNDDEPVDGNSNDDGSDDPHSITICGGLRPFGLTHLWEQTQHHSTDHRRSGGSEKRTLRRGMYERSGPRTLPYNKSEFNEELAGKKLTSKTKWTEEEKTGNISSDQVDMACDSQSKWLEMDLGDCSLEISNNDTSKNIVNATSPKKKILAFRSLELALRY
eukprot:scaffold320623_cov76-Cyclotella_meneghiniana.AAC.2